jgi:transmembrane sensor
MTDKLNKAVKIFLQGKLSQEGEMIWNSWFQQPNVVLTNSVTITSSSSDLQKEIQRIKRKSFRLFGLNYSQMQMAASVIVIIGLGTWFNYSTAIENLLFPLVYEKSVTQSGENATICLSDGTLIHLNAESVLKYPSKFSGNTREVYLEGEAFFEVAKDKKHPFIIHSSKMDTKVVGTSFNILAYPNQKNQEVSVVTGKVSVSSTVTKQNVLVFPGQKATIEKETNNLKAYSQINISAIASWRKNILVFEDVTVNEVIATMERHYGVKIKIQNESLQNLIINASFEEAEPEQVLNLLCKSIDASFKQEKNSYIIK